MIGLLQPWFLELPRHSWAGSRAFFSASVPIEAAKPAAFGRATGSPREAWLPGPGQKAGLDLRAWLLLLGPGAAAVREWTEPGLSVAGHGAAAGSPCSGSSHQVGRLTDARNRRKPLREVVSAQGVLASIRLPRNSSVFDQHRTRDIVDLQFDGRPTAAKNSSPVSVSICRSGSEFFLKTPYG